jgi:hypothetical protein
MSHRVFGRVNLGINPIGLIFRVNLLVIYFWGDLGGTQAFLSAKTDAVRKPNVDHNYFTHNVLDCGSPTVLLSYLFSISLSVLCANSRTTLNKDFDCFNICSLVSSVNPLASDLFNIALIQSD